MKEFFKKNGGWLFLILVFLAGGIVFGFIIGHRTGRANYWGVPQNVFCFKEGVKYDITPLTRMALDKSYVWVSSEGDRTRIMLLGKGIRNWVESHNPTDSAGITGDIIRYTLKQNYLLSQNEKSQTVSGYKLYDEEED